MGIALWLQPSENSTISHTLQTAITELRLILNDPQLPIFEPHITITSGIILPTDSQHAADIVVNEILDKTLEHIKKIATTTTITGLGDHLQRQRPLKISFGNNKDISHGDHNITPVSIQYGTKYFQACYLEAQKRHDLISLATFCRQEFVYQSSSDTKSMDTSITNNGSKNTNNKGDVSNSSSTVSTSDDDDGDQGTATVKSQQLAEAWAQTQFNPHLSLIYTDTLPIDPAQKRRLESRFNELLDLNRNSKSIQESDSTTTTTVDLLPENYNGVDWDYGRISLVRCEGPVHEWVVLGYRDIPGL